MPNLPGRGLFGRPDIGVGAPGAATEVWATLPAVTIPAAATEVWCGDANHVPQLVWASTADAPTGVAAAYTNVGGAASQVTVTWTPHAAPIKADSYLIKRADGSVAGTVSGASTASFVDTEPHAVTGVYTVTAQLGNVSSAPVASNSLALGNPPQSMSATWNGTTKAVDLVWAAPTYGQPDGYYVFLNGVLLGPLPGTTTAWSRPQPAPAGQTDTYVVQAVIGGVAGGTATDTEAVPSGAPVGIASTLSGSFRAQDVILTWSTPAYGTPDHYDIVKDGVYLGAIAGTSGGWTDSPTVVGETHTYVVRAQFLGGAYGDATIAVPVPAAPPTCPGGVTIAAGCTHFFRTAGHLDFGYFYPPAFGDYTGWELQKFPTTLGAWSALTTVAPNPSGEDLYYAAYDGAPEYVRIRTISNGAPSAWFQFGPV